MKPLNLPFLILRALLLFILLIILISLTIPPLIFAQTNLQAQETVVLKKDEVINKDFFASGESITIAGTVNGDAYIAGGNINIEGEINGDLLVAGGNITIRGKVLDDVRTAGGQIIISGEVGKNITAAGGSVTIADSAKIGGNVVAGAGSLMVLAPISKDITAGAGQLTIGSAVGGDITTGVGELNLTPEATVSGNLNYWSETRARIDPGAQVIGGTNQFIPEKRIDKDDADKALAGIWTIFKTVSFLSALILGLILIRLTPNYMLRVAKIAGDRPWMSLLVGFLTITLTPILSIILLITVLGIPAALIILAVFFILIYFAKIFIALLLGQKILELLNQKANIYWTFLFGLLIYYLISLVPFVSGLATGIATMIGVGALLIHRKEFYIDLKNKKLL